MAIEASSPQPKQSSTGPTNGPDCDPAGEDIPPVSAAIIEGLARDGDFGFEMRVGRDLRAMAHARVRHGESYVDHRTDKEREFDYQFSCFNSHRRLQLAIECKNAFRDSPIVVCGERRVIGEAFHDVVCAGNGALRGTSPHAQLATGAVSEVFCVSRSELYPVSDPAKNFVGKSVFRPKPPSKEKRAEAKRKNRALPFEGYTTLGDDDGYDAWNQALGSAADMAMRSLEYRPTPGQPAFAATVTLPVMVVPDRSLWRVEFNDDGVPVRAPESVDQVTLFCDHRVRKMDKIGTTFFRVVRLPHIHFYTQAGLRQLLSVLGNPHAMFWEYTFPEEKIEDFAQRFTATK